MQPTYWSIELLPGLSKQDQKLLQAQGITTTKELLTLTNNYRQQQKLATNLNVQLNYVRKWSALADLARIPSVGCQYCGLILHSGVVSVLQLTQTPLSRLHRQITRLQVATLQRKDLVPSIEEVKRWVEEAKLISRSINKQKFK